MKQALAAFAQANPDAASDPTFQAALAGAGQVSGGAAQLADALGAAGPQLQTLASGAAQVAGGAGKLSDGLGDYSAAVGRASAGAQKLSTGASQLSSGASDLAGGVERGERRHAEARRRHVRAGRRQRHAGRRSLVGQRRLGVPDVRPRQAGRRRDHAERRPGRAASGGARLAGALDTGASGIPAFTAKARRARAAMMSAPVAVTTEREDPVPNYGTGFAPYFIPLALWVGALMAYFLVRPLGGRALASTLRDPSVALSGLWPGVVITWLQAVVMLIVLQVALGLDPVKPVALYAFTLVAALTFAAILQLLSAAFGTAGKFVAVVLLMLQLTSSAGTFPIETVPRFFQVINPVLPMTYVVSGLRQAISGGDVRAVAADALILLAYAAAAVGLTVLTAHRRRTWTMDRLKPVLSL